jgi:hypothetical protein
MQTDILRNKWTQASGISLVSLGVGVVIGFFAGRRRVVLTVIRPDEPEQLDLFTVVETTTVEVEAPDAETALEKAEEVLEEPRIEINVFTVDDGDWDYELEEQLRSEEEPYVIHVEEFMENEKHYHQDTLTYYAGDDIMADSDDTPFYEYRTHMGELKFGHGSRDKNVVYIRNDRIEMEWEILLHQGKFAEEVLGLQLDQRTEKDIQHSVLKFRRE